MDESLTYFTPRTPVRGEPLIFTLGGTLLKSINDSTSYGVCLAGRELVPAFKVNWPIPAQGPGPFTTQYTTFWPIDAPLGSYNCFTYSNEIELEPNSDWIVATGYFIVM